MQGDTIIIEEYHRSAAEAVANILMPQILEADTRFTISVAGESGSGKSEIAAAIAEALSASDVHSIVLQQDDYFIYPPMSNDRERRKNISWVGMNEVKLDLMDQNLLDFVVGKQEIRKPLVIYKEDRITDEILRTAGAKVAIAEGTYTTALNNINSHVFIDRTYLDTRAHREKRSRHASELDPFIDKVLLIEHGIISEQRKRADIIINKDYTVSLGRT